MNGEHISRSLATDVVANNASPVPLHNILTCCHTAPLTLILKVTENNTLMSHDAKQMEMCIHLEFVENLWRFAQIRRAPVMLSRLFRFGLHISH